MSDKKKQKNGFFRVFLHTLFIQAVWNYKSMVSVGFTFGLWAKCRHLFTDESEKIAFLKRHLSFFNAHPYMAPYAIGAVARLEEERKKNGSPDLASIEKLKNALIGPLGAIGDQVFWQGIKPAVTMLGLLWLILIPQLQIRLFILFLVLLIYNIPHFAIRYRGVKIGYEQGFSVYKYVKIGRFKKLIKGFKIIGALSLGVMLTVFITKTSTGDLKESAFFVVILVSAFLIRKNTSSIYLALLAPLLLAVTVGVIMVEL